MSTYNKTYILLKDYPQKVYGKLITVKVGTEITLYPNISVCYLSKDRTAFTRTEVENNPEWFKLKEPLFTTEDGVNLCDGETMWMLLCSGKRIIEVDCCRNPTKGLNGLIKYFSTKQVAEKWVEDNKLKEKVISIDALYDKLKDTWNAAKGVRVNECDVIYNTFEEYYANRNNPTLPPQKDYEILSYSNLRLIPHIGGIRIKGADGRFRFNSHVNDYACDEKQLQYWDIHSVKRLSDGKIFTLGDIILGKKIVCIKITKDDVRANFIGGNFSLNIDWG